MILSTLAFLLLPFISISQTSIEILDEDGNALPGAHITYSTDQNSKKQTVLSDLSGKVQFTDEAEVYYVESAYIGYLNRLDTLKAGEQLAFRMKVDDITLNQVVITGQYSPGNPEKSIHKIKVIQKEEMEKRGVVNLNDALQFETNLRIGQDNVLGSSASIQGLSGENVKIMIDGVPVIGRQDGNIDLNQINMNNIERIEIVEGPLSVNYGSNALAGTINLITKKDSKKKYDASVNTYYESVGQYNIDAGISSNFGKHRVSANIGRNFFDGWSPDEEYSILPQSKPADTSRFLQWKPKEQVFGNVQYSLRNDLTTYRFFGDYFRESIISRGRPREPYHLTAFDEYFHTYRYNVGFDFNGQISANTYWNVLASYNNFRRTRYTYFKNLTDLDEELTDNPEDHDTTRIHSAMSRGSIRFLPKNAKLNGEVGYDINVETAFGKRIEDGQQSIGDYALFSSAEWRPTKTLTIKPGLRYAYNTAYSAPLIPSLNFRFSRNKLSMRASYARGFRAPSLKELYFEFVDVNHNIYGNSELDAESSNNIQFDATYKIIKKQRITQLEAGLFFNDVYDMISLAQVDNALTYTYINIGRYRTQGLELNVNQSIDHWKMALGFVYTGRSDITTEEVSSNIFYSPEFRANLTYEFKKIGGNCALFYKYNGEIPIYSVDDVGTTEQNFAEEYQIVDIAATKYIWKKRINWTFGVKNLLDVQNIATANSSGGIHSSGGSSVPVAWGRSFFTSIRFNMGW